MTPPPQPPYRDPHSLTHHANAAQKTNRAPLPTLEPAQGHFSTTPSSWGPGGASARTDNNTPTLTNNRTLPPPNRTLPPPHSRPRPPPTEHSLAPHLPLQRRPRLPSTEEDPSIYDFRTSSDDDRARDPRHAPSSTLPRPKRPPEKRKRPPPTPPPPRTALSPPSSSTPWSASEAAHFNTNFPAWQTEQEARPWISSANTQAASAAALARGNRFYKRVCGVCGARFGFEVRWEAETVEGLCRGCFVAFQISIGRAGVCLFTPLVVAHFSQPWPRLRVQIPQFAKATPVLRSKNTPPPSGDIPLAWLEARGPAASGPAVNVPAVNVPAMNGPAATMAEPTPTPPQQPIQPITGSNYNYYRMNNYRLPAPAPAPAPKPAPKPARLNLPPLNTKPRRAPNPAPIPAPTHAPNPVPVQPARMVGPGPMQYPTAPVNGNNGDNNNSNNSNNNNQPSAPPAAAGRPVNPRLTEGNKPGASSNPRQAPSNPAPNTEKHPATQFARQIAGQTAPNPAHRQAANPETHPATHPAIHPAPKPASHPATHPTPAPSAPPISTLSLTSNTTSAASIPSPTSTTSTTSTTSSLSASPTESNESDDPDAPPDIKDAPPEIREMYDALVKMEEELRRDNEEMRGVLARLARVNGVGEGVLQGKGLIRGGENE